MAVRGLELALRQLGLEMPALAEPRMPESPPFTIVGSGLAGALLACYLGRDGHRVDLHEKRADPRVPIVANVDAEPKRRAADAIEALVAQVSAPVLWDAVVRRLAPLLGFLQAAEYQQAQQCGQRTDDEHVAPRASDRSRLLELAQPDADDSG